MLDAIGRSTAAIIISMEDHSALRASTAFTAELTEITVTQKGTCSQTSEKHRTFQLLKIYKNLKNCSVHNSLHYIACLRNYFRLLGLKNNTELHM